MKASVLDGLQQPLVLKDVPTPTPAAGEALIQLKAAALNHRDVFIQQGQYPGLKFPCILGSDGAGIVTCVGKDVDESWLGREVIINPGLLWGNNPKYPSKSFRILGLPDDGTFAEYIRIPSSQLYAKPTHLSFEEAAAIPLAGLTGFRALYSRADVQPNDKVLITGIGGGVALCVLQFALASAAQVYVTSSSDAKIEQAKKLGAVGGINYQADDWSKQLKTWTQNEGFDVIIDSAGGEGFGKLIELAAPGGRIAIYGGTHGNWKDVSPQRVFYKQLNIFGSTMGSPQEFQSMLNFIEEKQLHPVIDRIFPLAEAEQAMRRMEKAEQFGKLVLKME
ncbi:MAG: zinc-binding dehydrogenase [Bacteroidota bacterium]